ncbi:hypothetical protein DFH05DRAFT_454063 [Lentinula detonsa]|uniref:Uncharacterized protein n=1 Tax=Lentinula detonsa TaxID=2804962 RepID=A0A9W8TTN3_9AGAR|nr:hypothetical protein DFH05DRAFT_454063 [Lentinula detonsa]
MTPSSSLAVDEGKRRSSMDKTKVSHLSRQLQLRLQYAKLKVEHGWHKQNLNEVENLYFRRTNSRPRQQSAYGPITQTSYSSTNNAQPLAPQTLSFKAHAFSSKVSESEQVRPHNSSAFPSSLSSAVIPSVHSATPPIAVTPNDAQSSSQGANNSPAQTSSLLPSPHIGPTFSPVVSMSLHTNSSNVTCKFSSQHLHFHLQSHILQRHIVLQFHYRLELCKNNLNPQTRLNSLPLLPPNHVQQA